MPIRHFADINQTSDAYGGNTNASMNRHEEFRLERNREANGRPRQTKSDRMEEGAQRYRAAMAKELQWQNRDATAISNHKVVFEGRSYTLPNSAYQQLSLAGEARQIDYQFGGLKFQQHMYDLYQKTFSTINRNNLRIMTHNEAIDRKSSSLLGKLKKSKEAHLVCFPIHTLIELMNNKFNEARIPVQIYRAEGYLMVTHPSAKGGDLHQAMKDWSEEHWQNTPERPWTNFLVELPKLLPE